jgi:hypothetical protein
VTKAATTAPQAIVARDPRRCALVPRCMDCLLTLDPCFLLHRAVLRRPAVTSSELYALLSAEDERNQPSPYFRKWDAPPDPEAKKPPQSELAKLALAARRGERNAHDGDR